MPGLIPRSGPRWTKMDYGSRGAIACDGAPIIDRSWRNVYGQKKRVKSLKSRVQIYLSGNEGENVGEVQTVMHPLGCIELLISPCWHPGPVRGVSF